AGCSQPGRGPRAGRVLRAGRSLATRALARADPNALEPGAVASRSRPDDGRRPDEALLGRGRRARASLRPAPLPRPGSSFRARRGSAEPRRAGDHLRPALCRRGGLLEGGDGACRPSLAPRHRLRCRYQDGRALPARPSEMTGRPDRAPTDTALGRRGLGRGLEVLIGGAGTSDLAQVPVDLIHPSPRQPRKRFDHEATAGLAESIRAQGIIQPVVLRPRAAGGYELIAGERRWRAAREAGVEALPAL